MVRWTISSWEWLRDLVGGDDDEQYPTYHDYPDWSRSPELIAWRTLWVHQLFELYPEVLNEGRRHTTTRAINQLGERFTKESRERLIAEAERENE